MRSDKHPHRRSVARPGSGTPPVCLPGAALPRLMRTHWAAPSCVLFALLSATTLLACSPGDRFTTRAKTPDAVLDQNSAVPPDAGLDALPLDAAQEPACDPSSTPGQVPRVISDDYALFVSPNGSADTSTCCTRANPCASLHGIWAAAQAQHKKRVYICDNGVSYDEDVEIDGTASGVQV